MHYLFCPVCGKKLSLKEAGDDGLVPFCDDCGKYWFDSFSTCVIVLVTNENHDVLLLRQNYLSDKYATFVSGYMTPGENAESAALREVEEEIGIKLDRLEFGGTYWFSKKGLLMIGFIGITNKKDFTLSSEVDSAQWTPLNKVSELIFPKNTGSVAYALYEKYNGQVNKTES